MYNGVDTALFYPVIKKEKEVFAIGIIANLIKIKGHEYLIKGLKRYIEKSGNKKVILKIIGDGPEKGNILRLVNSLNLTNNVSMIDCLSYEDIAKFLREQCDMFIMPSFFEAFGCVYLEAMACKIPTVGVFECGIAEIIENNVNGFLVHKNNVDEITKCIENVIDNRQSLIIAENGYITVKEQFTWKQSANNLYNIYCSLLKNGGIKKR